MHVYINKKKNNEKNEACIYNPHVKRKMYNADVIHVI